MDSNPIRISKIQMRLAMELGAQQASQREYARQVNPQLPWYARINEVDAPIDMEIPDDAWPVFEIEGRPVEWTE